MSKLISEADKLLEKGKIREALEKLKAAQKAEPLNQLVATKLANAFVINGETDKAVKVFVALADRLSEAGKAQVAIAIYKQALELDPADISLKVKYAIECEAAGKISEAQNNANVALKHYLLRKKYFDAADLMPILVRINGKDEKLKQIWIETLQLSQAEQKLIHLLVALCAPPGLVSSEFAIGDEPPTLSPALYDSLKRLVPFFPRDPKIAYAVAWSARRCGNLKEYYHFLRECLRRDPDFCLALLLFARTLAEQQKLNESLFVYKHLKERVMADKSVEMSTLNRMIDEFVEKNGWISFSEGDALTPAAFCAAIAQVSGAAAETPAVSTEAAVPPVPPPLVDPTPPASTDLFSAAANESASAESPPAPAAAIDPVDIFSPPPVAPSPVESEPEDAVEKGSPASQAQKVPEVGATSEIELGTNSNSEMEVEFTSETRLIKSPSAKAPAKPAPAEPTPLPVAAPAPTLPPAEKNSSPKIVFNPFESSAPKIIDGEELKPALEAGEKTEIFSPVELLGAADRLQGKKAEVKTKIILNRPEDLAEVASPRGDLPIVAPESAAPPLKAEAEVRLEGPATQLFDPLEALAAGAASRRPYSAAENLPSEADAALEPDGATMIVPMGEMSAGLELPAAEEEAAPVVSPPDEEAGKGAGLTGKMGGAFMRIPDLSASPGTNPPEANDGIDMGDDLLHEPTRILVVKTPEATGKLVKELEGDLGSEKAVDAAFLLRKSERYIAKRNYYMARKILRHALVVGGDETRIKERLRDIRKLELPDSLYNAISSDEGAKEGSGEILDRLEQEFDLQLEVSEGAAELASNIDLQMENIFRETDPRTILDFGVALHEMGLFRQAETVFSRLVDEFPETSFDAYYLAAVSKFSRKDYAGAVSILKTLSADGGKTELEKIQVYYALGELFEKMQRPDSSKEFYKKVADLDANYRNVRHKLEE